MGSIKVGAGRVCITPPIGTALSGYFTPRYATGIHDDLFATAISFDDGKNKAIIISLDLCGLKNQWWLDECKKKISEFCSVPEKAIIITCTHTHTGPVVGPDEISGAESNKLYDDYLMIKIRDAAFLSLKNLKPSRFYASSGTAGDIAFVRLFRMKNGKVKTNPGIGNPDIFAPISKAPEDVTLIKIERENDKDIFMVNFGVHADVIGGTDISADFPGAMRDIFESTVPDSICMFLQGAEGDLNHINVKWKERPNGAEHACYMGNCLAQAAIDAFKSLKELECDEIKFDVRNIKIPTNKENHKLADAKKIINLKEHGDSEPVKNSGVKNITSIPEAMRIIQVQALEDELSFNLSAISVGKIVFAGLPGEPFAEIGKKIKENSAFDVTVVCALTDGGEVYFPTENLYDEDTYESKSSFVKKGADNKIIKETLKLLSAVEQW